MSLEASVRAAVDRMTWLRPTDGAAVDLALAYAVRIDVTLDTAEGVEITKALGRASGASELGRLVRGDENDDGAGARDGLGREQRGGRLQRRPGLPADSRARCAGLPGQLGRHDGDGPAGGGRCRR